MSVWRIIHARWRDQSGSVLVEFAVVIVLFSFLFYILIDFGRLSYSRVNAEKAAHMAVRLAVVRAPACGGVPDVHERGTISPAPVYGTACSAASQVCAVAATVTCNGSATNATAQEIWARITPLLPDDATINNMQFAYRFDPNLGFLGGPYTPMVTVELNLPAFQFISPLGALAAAASNSTEGTIGSEFAFPSFSVSLPAEDLNVGISG